MNAGSRKLLGRFVVGSLILLAAAEGGLALLLPQATWRRTQVRTPTEDSELLPFQLVPNARTQLVTSEFDTAISINSSGHRSPEFEAQPGECTRILAVGDSFTYGWGVDDDETWPYLLERELSPAEGSSGPQGPCTEVINAGFAAGLSPDTYYLYLKRIGLGWQPDVVVVGFFLGNDVEFHGSTGGSLEWSEVDEAGLPTRIRRGSYELVDASEQVQIVQRRYRYPILRNSHLVQAAVTLARRIRQPRADFNHWLYRADYAERTSEKVELTKTVFRALAEACREADVALVIVMIPAREQVLPEQYSFAGLDYMQDADLEKPQRLFATFFEQEDIRYLDLLPLLRTADPAELYYPIDLHWTPKGTAWAARTIASYLVDAGLLAPRER